MEKEYTDIVKAFATLSDAHKAYSEAVEAMRAKIDHERALQHIVD